MRENESNAGRAHWSWLRLPMTRVERRRSSATRRDGTWWREDAHDARGESRRGERKSGGSTGSAFGRGGRGPARCGGGKATDYLKVAKNGNYGRKGYPKGDTITWKPVVDNNSRAALMQTGEAQFTFPVPYELADVLKGKPDPVLVPAPSTVLRSLPMNTHQQPAPTRTVRHAIADPDRYAFADAPTYAYAN